MHFRRRGLSHACWPSQFCLPRWALPLLLGSRTGHKALVCQQQRSARYLFRGAHALPARARENDGACAEHFQRKPPALAARPTNACCINACLATPTTPTLRSGAMGTTGVMSTLLPTRMPGWICDALAAMRGKGLGNACGVQASQSGDAGPGGRRHCVHHHCAACTNAATAWSAPCQALGRMPAGEAFGSPPADRVHSSELYILKTRGRVCLSICAAF